ncbi:hypothetical protein ACPPVV_12640 [Rhodanobacter sp. Col0626]|uniref:hypothetical protein n=1 Tax=Rhodanobacter sp. Col0626 TaxID=3415679 RepID=UPI003CEA154D
MKLLGSSANETTHDVHPRKFSSGCVFTYVLVIGVGLICGIVLAVITGFAMGWINIQC